MNRKWRLLLLFCACLLLLSGCACKHEWVEADCVSAKTCSKCGETEGEALGHDWIEATCTEPKTCARCGETEGEALGHDWAEATCTEPKTCARCGETEGEALDHDWAEATCTEPKTCARCGETEGVALGHDWTEATCTEPKTCTRCGETEGEALGHSVEEWTITTESTCTEPGEQTGVCTVCEETVKEPLELAEHTPGDWEVITEATEGTPGERVQHCAVCGGELAREEFTLTPEEIKQQYIDKCSTYTYEEIARNPDAYSGEYAKLKGEVIQVMEDGDTYTLRVNITQKRYGWTDAILVSYTKQSSSEPRILEDDIVMLYGMLFGTYTYETVMGNEMTVPLMFAEYVDIQ